MNHPDHDSSLVELTSAHSFEITRQRLLDGVHEKGLTLFAQIDHAALAAAAGLSMPPTIVLLYGNPKGGTPIMVAVPAAALDLPLRLLVRQDSANVVKVAYHQVVTMLERIGLAREMADRLAPAQAWIAAAIAPGNEG